MDMVLGNATSGALMITLLGTVGFWLPTAAFNELLLMADLLKVEKVNLHTSDIQAEIIEAVPLDDAQ